MPQLDAFPAEQVKEDVLLFHFFNVLARSFCYERATDSLQQVLTEAGTVSQIKLVLPEMKFVLTLQFDVFKHRICW